MKRHNIRNGFQKQLIRATKSENGGNVELAKGREYRRGEGADDRRKGKGGRENVTAVDDV